ncbi:MAG: NAD(P)-dependent oxidoreductase [Sphingobium sp.]
MHSLPLFLRLTARPVILVGDGEAAQAKRRLLERAGAIVVAETAEAAVAIVALEDRAEQDAAASRLRARKILLNVVDRADLSDFTMPAIVDRDPVLIAIGTGGASAGLAKAVRQRIERILPPRLGALAAALSASRTAMRDRWPGARDRRAALDAALAQGGALDPFASHDDGAVGRWLMVENMAAGERVETVLLASTDPDDLTLRTARLLGEADLVLHDPQVPAAILDRARADAVREALPGGGPRGRLTVILKITPL